MKSRLVEDLIFSIETIFEISNPTVKIINPNIRKGNNFPMMNWCFLIGVTLICSSVPNSFSLTIFMAERNKVNIVTSNTKIPGTINVL